jgi:hypothetical protein
MSAFPGESGFLRIRRLFLRTAKPRPLVEVSHRNIYAFNYLDLICHLDFDIFHSNHESCTIVEGSQYVLGFPSL